MVCLNTWDQLISLHPPELTHYYENSHPGVNWWLKCAVLHVCEHVVTYWHQLQAQMPEWIVIQDQAWDWHGDLIPNCSSVWCHVQVDVHVWEQDHVLHHEILPYAHSLNQFITHMQQQLTLLPENATWHNMQQALHLMHTHVSDREARMRRNQFEVIHGEKATSSKRARQNMDPERPR